MLWMILGIGRSRLFWSDCTATYGTLKNSQLVAISPASPCEFPFGMFIFHISHFLPCGAMFYRWCRSWCHKGPCLNILNGFSLYSFTIATTEVLPTHRSVQAFTSLPDANLNAKMALLGSIAPPQAEIVDGCNGLGHKSS